MQLIVDANVLLSALIKDSKTRELLIDSRLELFAPEFLLREVQKHIFSDPEVRRKINVLDSEISEFLSILLHRIKVFNKEEYSRYFNESSKLVKHDKDVPYVALSLKLGLPLWSNDKGLKEQSTIRVFNTKDLVEELSKHPK